MVHIAQHDVPLLITSIIVAVITCFLALSLDLIVKPKNIYSSKRFPLLFIVSGAILGCAIWLMHFLGMLAMLGTKSYYFSHTLTFFSYIIAAISSTFAVVLSSTSHLSTLRILIAAVLMGLGMAGMHYTGMLGLHVEGQIIVYHPLWMLLSVLAGVVGSAYAFLQMFNAKRQQNYGMGKRWLVSCSLAFTIVALHHIGVIASEFRDISPVISDAENVSSHVIVITILFVLALFVIIGVFLASLESRLQEKSNALNHLNQQLADLAFQDNLTKLPNRTYLDGYTKKIFESHQIAHQQIAFLYIDVDHFKMINDVFGHDLGDQLLINIVKRLQKFTNERAKLIRVGGDEFLLIMEHSYLTEAVHIAEKILEDVETEYFLECKQVKTSLSIGIAMYPEHGENLKDLLISADMAMFLSKQQGRNTYRIFNDSLDAEKIKDDYQLVQDLNKALQLCQFELFYQPKFDQQYKMCGTEALIRWYHPERGMVSPLQFIDVAERTGLIVPIGYWVLEQACKQIQIWKNEKKEFYPISINLSAHQFEHPELGAKLKSVLAQYQVEPHQLIVEITESTILRQVDLSIQSFEALRKMGIQIAIDDFGTGYSSFSYLKDFPFDELKIDKEFITHLTENSKEEAILESIIQLAIKLGLRVIAEGVETREQAEILLRLGCHQLQGFLLAKPMPVKELEKYQPPIFES